MNPDSTRSLRIFFALATIVCAALLLTDWGVLSGHFRSGGSPAAGIGNTNNSPNSVPGTPTNRVSSPQLLSKDDPSREFLYKEYDTAVNEIRLRLAQESVLFNLKFTLVGAVLAVFFGTYLKDKSDHKNASAFRKLGESPMAAFFFWAAVITIGVVDCRILFNADFIASLGKWIQQTEPLLLQQGEKNSIVGWENFLAVDELMPSRLYPLLRLNAHLLTLLFFASTMAIFFIKGVEVADETGERNAIYTQRISSVGAAGSLLVFALAGLHFHYGLAGWGWACAIIWALGIVSLGLCHCVRNPALKHTKP